MNGAKTTGLQSLENATLLFRLSTSPHIEDIFSGEFVYYDFKILWCVY